MSKLTFPKQKHNLTSPFKVHGLKVAITDCYFDLFCIPTKRDMNPILLQKQLKENANDLQDFYKDLNSWGEEMKRKEGTLKSNEDTSKKPKAQATIAAPKVKRAPNKEKAKISSTDYSKWEKYDADLACERLEEDIKDDSELTDEFEESTRDEALVHKEKGNSYVKMKEWSKAIDCYTKAINCYSYDPVFYANRALCYLKKDSFIEAEEDCTLALKLDSTYVKALQRRGAAREFLGKLEQAEGDLQLVLTHEPKNNETIAALGRIRKKLGVTEKAVEEEQRPISKFTASRNKGQLKPILSNSSNSRIAVQKVDSKIDTSIPSESVWPDPGCDIIPVKAINKPPHIRSTTPLKRIEIAEVDGVSKAEEPENPYRAPEAFKQHVVEHIKEVTFKDNVVDASEPVEKTSAFKRNREKVKNEKTETSSYNENVAPKAHLKNDFIRIDDELRVIENKSKETKNTENSFQVEINSSKTTKDSINSVNKEFSIPKNSVQFYSTWKTIKTPEEKYKYLKLIEPQEIPKIFRESLESNVFSDILNVLNTSFIENEDDGIYDYLLRLTQVKRFSTLAMFMDSTDKSRLWKLVIHLREKDKASEGQVDDLIREYEL